MNSRQFQHWARFQPARTVGMIRTVCLASLIVTLGACSSRNDNVQPGGDTGGDGNPPLGSESELEGMFAFVASRAADYGSGRIDRISLADGNVIDGSYPAALSDIDIDTDGVHPYQIGRFNIDSITRFDAVDTSIVDYQYSVLDTGTVSANPQDIAFVDSSKAYLTRRGSSKLWIINPDAALADDFKIGEIDLGAYDIDLPNMTDAIIVDNKLFVLIERLLELPQAQVPDKRAYVAVFNTITDTEIDTNQGAGGLKGIELLVTNPTSLQYDEATGQIYLVGRGNYFESTELTTDFHSGGIQVIDPTTYQHSVILDDGTDTDNQGYFLQVEIIDAGLGYLVTYASFGDASLRTFNPSTGLLSDETIPELQNIDITTIAEGPDGHLWVGINDASPGFYRIDLATGLLAPEFVATSLVPQGIAFITP
ncbi:MAG: hypothetical protein HKN42_11275 [Granulosicoccus sp.]|nr:hypothetical protein [Granulosicoccus sp.]